MLTTNAATGLVKRRYSIGGPRRDDRGKLLELPLYAGKGVGAVRDIPSAGDLVARLWKDCLPQCVKVSLRRHQEGTLHVPCFSSRAAVVILTRPQAESVEIAYTAEIRQLYKEWAAPIDADDAGVYHLSMTHTCSARRRGVHGVAAANSLMTPFSKLTRYAWRSRRTGCRSRRLVGFANTRRALHFQRRSNSSLRARYSIFGRQPTGTWRVFIQLANDAPVAVGLPT